MNIIFSDDFIKRLPEDNMLALTAICDEYNSFSSKYFNDIGTRAIAEQYSSELINAYAFLLAIVESREIELPTKPFDKLPDDPADAVERIDHTFKIISKYVGPIARNSTLKLAKERYLQTLNGFLYEFSKGDIKNIKQLIKDLREQLESCKELDDDHKARVIKKLNDLDSEINIKMTNLDKTYALIVEAQILVHKLGEASKPYIQIIKTIVNFAWRAEARAEGLSSDTYLILPEESDIEALAHADSTICEEENK